MLLSTWDAGKGSTTKSCSLSSLLHASHADLFLAHSCMLATRRYVASRRPLVRRWKEWRQGFPTLHQRPLRSHAVTIVWCARVSWRLQDLVADPYCHTTYCTLPIAHYLQSQEGYLLSHYLLHTTYCTLRIAHCLLHTAYCTLLTAHYSLHTTHCTLATAHYLLAHYLLHITYCTSLTAH